MLFPQLFRLSRRLMFLWLLAWMIFMLEQPATATDLDAFPVTIEHALGKTTITSEPQRIVTFGWNAEDAVLALGKYPIAMPRYSFFPSGIFPWNEEKLQGRTPVLMAGRTVDFEQIASLHPDLILAISSNIDAVTWKRLSTIAPTIAYRTGPFAADWREQTELVGLALGDSSTAKLQIKKTESFLQSLSTQYKQLRGKTFTFGTHFPGSSGIVVYLPADPRVSTLMELGLKPSAGVERLASNNPHKTSTTVSLEHIDTINADILIMWFGADARAALENQPLFQSLEVVRRGGYVALDDPVSVWSTSALSVLSIPYGFPKFVPRLAEAARKVEH